ncbi:hypothetical protein [Pseudoalteromonas pernae]|uniref:hypothetical protein n=1 Tax=Pseudoalteromonas pernae TaxID=3118054 RepID=UPI00324248F3
MIHNLAWRLMQPKKKRCSRCGLQYTAKLPQCEHCGHLDEQGLSRLKSQREREHQGHHTLGKYFLWATIIIAVLMLVSFF